MVKILIIEDDEGILLCLRRVLSHLGHDVKIARNGEEGIAMFEETNGFDLVITGIVMPLKDGNEVARYIRNSKRRDIPLVAMTGSGQKAVQRQLFNMALEKPFRMKTLIDAIGVL